MSQNKHTPGPWSYWSGYNHVDKFDSEVTAEGGDIVIARYNSLIEEGEANAKLIAAAPDLLDALDKMLDNEEQRDFEKWLRSKAPSGDCSDVQSQWLESSDYEDFLESWKLQIAAIAKARGDQP